MRASVVAMNSRKGLHACRRPSRSKSSSSRNSTPCPSRAVRISMLEAQPIGSASVSTDELKRSMSRRNVSGASFAGSLP
jgi:hypothetical protein